MKSLWSFFKGYRGVALLGPLLKLAEALLELAVPLVVAQIIDRILTGDGAIWGSIALLLGLALAGVLMAITAQYFSAKAAIGYTRQLTQALYQKISRLSESQRQSLGESSLITRVTNDTYQVQTGLNIFFRLFLRSPFIVFGAAYMAWQLNAQLASYLLVMILVLYLILAVLMGLTAPGYAKIRQATDRVVQVTQEGMAGYRVIRSFNQVDGYLTTYDQVNQNLLGHQLKTGFLAALTNPLTYLVVNVTTVLVLWQGDWALDQGLLAKGALVALVNYLTLILGELIKTTIVLGNLNKAWISAQRIQAVLAMPEEDPGQKTSSQVTRDTSDSTWQAQYLSYTYPGSPMPTIKQVSLQLQEGQWLGLTGVTGAGKTSLIKLLLGILPADQGNLVGPDAEDLAWVPQQAQLFKGTIRSNLLLAQDKASDQDLWQALALAQAADFVAEKGGLDAQVTAFGHNLSGGQRQRLTVARALLKAKKGLILDDATSALDYATESRLLSGLKAARPDLMVIMVSQRLNALRFADQILVLEDGQTTGYGPVQDLAQSNPYYRTLVQTQSQGGDRQ
ncbi:ABC transporter ATP-binding protein [Abiotrophia defectiva]|uniref:ABC transporter, ATP-binding protein n=2 Tax=Abiotrophia defectiva TaxID=46125 RepID=W1Q6D0_ABIDE|nr:ABC transporter ATP-binding protein [Abiotrophia defectiva]ESK66074.1 ABC transporter, ATP-binding protein [Abiotrophia defectiva ATCC 49176]QKH46359.1 ABC transporter ATP-binding protein [Abiotrophia defectiva]